MTQWIQESGQCSIGNVLNTQDLSHLRWTVDEPEDLDVVRSVVSYFKNRSDFSWLDVLRLKGEKPKPGSYRGRLNTEPENNRKTLMDFKNA